MKQKKDNKKEKKDNMKQKKDNKKQKKEQKNLTDIEKYKSKIISNSKKDKFYYLYFNEKTMKWNMRFGKTTSNNISRRWKKDSKVVFSTKPDAFNYIYNRISAPAMVYVQTSKNNFAYLISKTNLRQSDGTMDEKIEFWNAHKNVNFSVDNLGLLNNLSIFTLDETTEIVNNEIGKNNSKIIQDETLLIDLRRGSILWKRLINSNIFKDIIIFLITSLILIAICLLILYLI